MHHRLEISAPIFIDGKRRECVKAKFEMEPSLTRSEMRWLVWTEIEKVKRELAVKEPPKEHRHD